MNRDAKQDPTGESLYDRVNRAKHCWLKRVMTDPAVSSTAKCFAYIIMDKLNCVTRDAWPGQQLSAELLGDKSIKTVHRAAVCLQRRGYLHISRDPGGFYRYKPKLMPEDEDKVGAQGRQSRPVVPDKTVDESSLAILPKQSSPNWRAREEFESRTGKISNYRRAQRGAYEAEIARRLGGDGYQVLRKLADLGDHVLERLCRACAEGELGEREIIAARLAANQMHDKRRTI